MMKNTFSVAMILLILASSCKKQSSAPANHRPEVSFLSVLPNTYSVRDKDTLVISFEFSDKAGDVGNSPGTIPTPNIFFSADTGKSWSSAMLPDIPDYFRTQDGIKGRASMFIATRLIPFDSLSLVQGKKYKFIFCIADQAGNSSDTISTSTITALP